MTSAHRRAYSDCNMCDDEKHLNVKALPNSGVKPIQLFPQAISSRSRSCEQDCVAIDVPGLHSLGNGPGQGIASAALQGGARDAEIARHKLLWAALFCLAFMICEAFGGWFANSLAIMTDAAHLLADLAGFLISVFALYMSSRPATDRLSFGWYRLEIIGALMSVLLVWLVTGLLFVEAFQRFEHPKAINGKMMLIIAILGLIVNALIAWILHSSGHSHGHGSSDSHSHSHGSSSSSGSHAHSHGNRDAHVPLLSAISEEDNNELPISNNQNLNYLETLLEGHNVNVRAAIIHAIGDLVQSLGVILAAVIVWYKPHWTWVDPLCTFLFGMIVVYTTIGLLQECLHVLMEGAPPGMDVGAVRKALLEVTHVVDVHDLHIWSIKPGKPSLSVHLEIDRISHQEGVLSSAQDALMRFFKVSHSTIQVEVAGVNDESQQPHAELSSVQHSHCSH